MARTLFPSPRNAQLRCSDAERERVADFLRDHAAEGRLTHDELDDRVGLAYRAVTIGDLDRLTGDLPSASLDPGGRPRAPMRGGPVVVVLAVMAALAALIPGSMWLFGIVGAVLAFTLAVTVLALGLALAPFVLVAAAAVYALRRLGDRSRLRPR
jgi:hypothetical protein